MKHSIAILLIVIMVLMAASCTPQESDANGDRSTDTETVTEESNSMDNETAIVAKATDSEKSARLALEAVHIALPDEMVTGAEEYSDDIGSGLQLTMDSGKVIIAYQREDGFVSRIRDTETGEYIYTVFE